VAPAGEASAVSDDRGRVIAGRPGPVRSRVAPKAAVSISVFWPRRGSHRAPRRKGAGAGGIEPRDGVLVAVDDSLQADGKLEG